MIIRSKINCAVNPTDYVTTMTSQHGRNVDAAFLQSLSRIEKIESPLNLAMHRFITAHLGALKARAQPINLIVDLAPAFIQRLGQRRIDASQLLLQAIQLALESCGPVIESFRGFLAHIL